MNDESTKVIRGLFSDGTQEYRNPPEPKENETVHIRFRTLKEDAAEVFLCVGETGQVLSMREEESNETFAYYGIDILLKEKTTTYYFKIIIKGTEYLYDRYGVTTEVRPQYFFQIVCGFSTPDWAKGAVMYQIMVDRFANGDTDNDVLDGEYYYIRGLSQRVPVEQWEKCPENFSVAEFYGGDLEGIRQKLDYLQNLGVEVIYMNPIFVSPSNHKYDIQDYDHIDPHFGKIVVDEGRLLSKGECVNANAERYRCRVTNPKNLEASNAFFAEFVKEVHKRGMKVILDGVFNHCGSFNRWLDRENLYQDSDGYAAGAYQSKDSPYRNYFGFSNQSEDAWPKNGSYEGWWGHDTLPKLNFEGSKELYEDILRIGEKWVSEPYNIDGWRLDVAADLGHSAECNHQFWRDFRKTVKQANPNAVILAEHYGDPKEWLLGDQWDTIMNYSAFMEPLTWFLTGMEKHSDDYQPQKIGNIHDFEGAMRHYMTSFLTPSLQCAMNQLSNHDHSRFLTRTNHKVGRVEQLGTEAASEEIDSSIMRQAVLVQMTWPGAPTLYYGDEAGVCGFTDPDNRRTYPWGHEDKDMIDLHRDLILIHKCNAALKTGSFTFLDSEDSLLCYARFNREQQFVMLVNCAEEEKTKALNVLDAGVPKDAKFRRRMITMENGYSLMPKDYEAEDGVITVVMKKKSAVILERV